MDAGFRKDPAARTLGEKGNQAWPCRRFGTTVRARHLPCRILFLAVSHFSQCARLSGDVSQEISPSARPAISERISEADNPSDARLKILSAVRRSILRDGDMNCSSLKMSPSSWKPLRSDRIVAMASSLLHAQSIIEVQRRHRVVSACFLHCESQLIIINCGGGEHAGLSPGFLRTGLTS